MDTKALVVLLVVGGQASGTTHTNTRRRATPKAGVVGRFAGRAKVLLWRRIENAWGGWANRVQHASARATDRLLPPGPHGVARSTHTHTAPKPQQASTSAHSASTANAAQRTGRPCESHTDLGTSSSSFLFPQLSHNAPPLPAAVASVAATWAGLGMRLVWRWAGK